MFTALETIYQHDAVPCELRKYVGRLVSALRIIRKADLEETDHHEVQLARLAENSADSQNLAQFFAALEAGVTAAADRTLRLLRKLRLSDVGQIQQLLLSAEGEPTGSYLVDVFDRVRSEEHTSELQSLMRISYAVFCLK